MQGTLSSLFSWAMRKGLAAANPVIAAEMRRERSRDRVLTDSELATVWNTLRDTDFDDILRLLILTGARAAEIGLLRWDEISFDLGVISLSGERTKNGRPFEIPMTEPMCAILQRRSQSRVGDWVFGRTDSHGFLGWGKCKARLDAKLGNIPHWTIHDLRRTAATRMADIGILPHVIEACLNHVSGHKGGIAGVYNRSLYRGEKAQALAQWAAHVLAVAEGKTSNITALKRA